MNEKKIKESNARTLAIQYQYPIFTMMTEYLLLKYDQKENGSVEQKLKEHLNFYMLVLNSDIRTALIGDFSLIKVVFVKLVIIIQRPYVSRKSYFVHSY